jgi:diguanylate cyclase (GGDEF)-like protein
MRIILVDPSGVVRRALTKLIEEDQHEVVCFADGLEALSRIALDEQVRALITSTQPLNISGIELCAAVRDLSGSRRAIHIMLMSSTDDLHLMISALDRGADDFIRKPPIAEELRARLRLADRVTSMKQQLIQYATRDSLTGLLNRRAFFERTGELCRAAQEGHPLSAILFDIDRFKQINDQYGHDGGDRVLATVAVELSAICPHGARIGGEEFCVLLQAQSVDALDTAADLQRSIKSVRFPHDGETFNVTCSFGVSEWEAGDTIDKMLRRADIAMYEAKRSGRDQIVMADAYTITAAHAAWSGIARAS